MASPVKASKASIRNGGVRDLSTQAAKRILKMKEGAVPVIVTVGAMALSGGLGLFTASRELRYCPDVLVNKKRRQEVPEIEEPDYVVDRATKYVNQSFFRKLGHKSSFYNQVKDGNPFPSATACSATTPLQPLFG